MAYTAPTASDFQARFPRFAAVAASTITAALARAAARVDESWSEEDFAEARMLYAAHDLTLDGFGSGAESEAALAGAAGFKVMKSGSLSLERFDSAPGTSASGLDATSYGQRYKALLMINRGGPRVTGAPV